MIIAFLIGIILTIAICLIIVYSIKDDNKYNYYIYLYIFTYKNILNLIKKEILHTLTWVNVKY